MLGYENPRHEGPEGLHLPIPKPRRTGGGAEAVREGLGRHGR